MSRVWSDAAIKRHSHLLVMLVLSDFSNDTGVSWPSIQTIATKSRCSSRTVQRIITALQKLGKLAVEREAARGGTNLYKIKFEGGCQSVTRGVTCVDTGGVTKRPVKGDIGLSPEPSVPTIEPPRNGVSSKEVGESLHLERVLRANQSEADDLKNRFCAEVAGGDLIWSDAKAKQRHRELRKACREITKRIGGMA